MVPQQPPPRPVLLLLLKVPGAPDRFRTLQTRTCTKQRFSCLPATHHLPLSTRPHEAGLPAGSPTQNTRRPGSRYPTAVGYLAAIAILRQKQCCGGEVSHWHLSDATMVEDGVAFGAGSSYATYDKGVNVDCSPAGGKEVLS